MVELESNTVTALQGDTFDEKWQRHRFAKGQQGEIRERHYISTHIIPLQATHNGWNTYYCTIRHLSKESHVTETTKGIKMTEERRHSKLSLSIRKTFIT